MAHVELASRYFFVDRIRGIFFMEANREEGSLNSHTFRLSVVQFYGWIVGAAVLVLAGCFALYSSMNQRVSSLDSDVKRILSSNERMAGQLDTLLPLVTKQVLERASFDPGGVGIKKANNISFDAFSNGWTAVESKKLGELLASGLVDDLEAQSDLSRPFTIVDCKRVDGEIAGGFPCKILSPDDLVVDWQQLDLKLNLSSDDVLKEIIKE